MRANQAALVHFSYQLNIALLLSFSSFPLFLPASLTACVSLPYHNNYVAFMYSDMCTVHHSLRDNKRIDYNDGNEEEDDENKANEPSTRIQVYRDWNSNDDSSSRKMRNNARSESHSIFIIDLRSNIVSNHDCITKFGVRDFLSTIHAQANTIDDMRITHAP